MPTFTAHRVSSRSNVLFPNRITVEVGCVTYYKGAIVGYQLLAIKRYNIASIYIAEKILFADIVISSIGGQQIVAQGFTKADAREIVRLLT
jgi:uncharacterized membrane protein